MASPLRSWSPRMRCRPTRRGRVAPAVESLEGRRLLASNLITVDASGLGGANGPSTDPDISGNGRYVVFTSTATNLVAEDTSSNPDVYLRDQQTGVTRLVSVATTGNAGNGASVEPSVSDDGRFVAFASTSSDIVSGDNNGDSDVFVRDMFLNTTTLVSANVLGTGPANGNSVQPAVSGDGKFVAFASDAINVTANDLTPIRDVFLRNLETSTTSLISLSGIGIGGNAASQFPSLNADGQFVAFVSEASDVVGAGAGGPGPDVYRRNTFAATTALVSTAGGVTGGFVDLAAGAPAIDDIGNFIAFVSSAADLVAGDTNGVNDVFRKNMSGGTVAIASENTAGPIGNGASTSPSISADGRYVAFASVASNMALPDVNSISDIFIHDYTADSTILATTDGNGAVVSPASTTPSITADGKLVAFARSGGTQLDVGATAFTNIYTATSLPLEDTSRPVLYVPPQPIAPQPPLVGDVFLPFVVIYDDELAVDASTFGDVDLIVTGPNGFRETAEFFSLSSTTGSSATVAYTVPAPGGTLSSEDTGDYTVTVRGNQIGDTARNFILTGSSGTFSLNLPISETVLPQPTFFGGSPAVGSQTYEFSVTYSERGGIDFASFGNDDLTVSGPNGFTQTATFVAQTPLNATQTNVVYRITAPGGTWDGPDAGVYTVSVIPGGVRDVGNNAVQAGPIGQFTALGPDLVPIPLRNLRSGAISGVDQQRARIRILNQGSFETTVPVAVTLFTSLDENLDPGDATIGTFIQERSIPADDFRDLRVRFTYPTVPEGNYFVIARVDSTNAVTEQNENNNVKASFNKVGLSAPFVDLVPTLVPFAGGRSRLGTNEVVIKIRNAGNVAATGDVVVALTAVSDVTPTPSERPVTNIPVTLSLKPGQTRTFRLPFTFPIEFERGIYKMVATIDSANIFPERDETNNRVVSLSEFSFA